jgi:predicted nucleic acid-binding protein
VTIFVDTNVLVCARDSAETSKQPIAARWIKHLWATGTGRLSTQVLNEYYTTVTRKLRQPMAPQHARADVRDLSLWDPVQITTALIAHAWTVEDRFGFSWWDSLVVASAQLADADHLLSEDLQDGQNLDGVVVVNPFLHNPDSFRE